MNISIISFTKQGMKQSQRIKKELGQEYEITLYYKSKNSPKADIEIQICKDPLTMWAAHRFESGEAIIFIGACGIAVRALAPVLQDKLQDSPVLVIDEQGRYIIPLLSGHYGGANKLANLIAERMHMTAVITTATDLNHLFAVDVFAKENQLVICNRNGIKQISSRILAGETVQIAIDGSYEGKIPKELNYVELHCVQEIGILVSPYKRKEIHAGLRLCPKVFYIGIGCRKGKSFAELEQVVDWYLECLGIDQEAIAGFASIDIKRTEKGLCELAARYRRPLLTFASEELMQLPGNFTASDFVRAQVGVENVCERAAVAAAGKDSELVLHKQIEHGITIAVVRKKWGVRFDET